MFYVDLSQNRPGDLPKVCFVVPVDPTPAPGKLCLVAFDPVVRVLSSENSKLTMGTQNRFTSETAESNGYISP
jgi:hypothetical protein